MLRCASKGPASEREANRESASCTILGDFGVMNSKNRDLSLKTLSIQLRAQKENVLGIELFYTPSNKSLNQTLKEFSSSACKLAACQNKVYSLK